MANVTDTNYLNYRARRPMIGSGGSREVFDLGDGTVLKIDRPVAATVGNCASEVALWEQVKGTAAARYFAPIVAHGEGWLVMVKCDDSVTLEDGEEWEAEMADNPMMRETGVLRDAWNENMGFLNGEIVLLDYAANKLFDAVSPDYCKVHDLFKCWYCS